MFRPDIYLVILKTALKMSFWCSKNKILAEGFFSMSSQKNSILEHENQIFASQQALCLDQTFTWLFSKLHWKCHSGAVPNYLTATVSWDTSVKNIYSGTAVKYILVQVQHTFQPISNNQKESHTVSNLRRIGILAPRSWELLKKEKKRGNI